MVSEVTEVPERCSRLVASSDVTEDTTLYPCAGRIVLDQADVLEEGRAHVVLVSYYHCVSCGMVYKQVPQLQETSNLA